MKYFDCASDWISKSFARIFFTLVPAAMVVSGAVFFWLVPMLFD